MSSDQQNPTVSILVVAFNSRGFIKGCLSSIPDACANIPFEILLIDNGTDGTDRYVRESFPEVRIVPSQGNVGYGTGNNILAAHADPGSEFLLILNPDTQLFPKAIEGLVLAARTNPEFGALSGAPRSDDDAEDPLPMVALPTLRGVLYGTLGLAHRNAARRLKQSSAPGLWEMEALSGFFVLIRKALWNEIGGFDESFFLYGEDADFSRRLAQTGAKLGLVITSQVKHDTGSGAVFSTARQHFMVLGSAQYANKHFGPMKRTTYKVVLWVQCLTKFVGSSLLKHRSGRMAAMAEAFRSPATKPWQWYRGYNAQGADPRTSAVTKQTEPSAHSER